MVTRCYLCGGETERRRVTAENWWGEDLALVENVPAWVCRQCGEAHFEAETSRQLDRLRKAPPSISRTLRVPAYPFEAVA
ncbi:MAG TPA: type II toxin-antitoxin system MqsA family antitoxin [Chloroflexota bacterium]